MPKCSCYVWGKIVYLRKHFFCSFWTIFVMVILCIIIDINSSFWKLLPLYWKIAPFKMPLLWKKQNEIVSNLEEAYKIYENTIINFQHLPSQARWKTATFEIIRESLKGVKDLSYLVENEDTADDALGYLTNIRRFLKGSVSQKSDISVEPTKSGPIRKIFPWFVLKLSKKKDRSIGRMEKLSYLRNMEM